MSDEDRKKSWREIDQARDRGIKFQKTNSKKEEFAQKLASKAAKKDLDALFSSSKLSKEKETRIAEIQSLRGKPTYYEKIAEYYKEYGLPQEWEAQMIFLDHRDTNLVLEILEELKKTAPRESLQRQDLLGQKLRVMSLSTFDSRLIDKIKEVQNAILSR